MKPLDLDAIRRSAARTDTPDAVVTRRFLASVVKELEAGRAAIAAQAGRARA